MYPQSNYSFSLLIRFSSKDTNSSGTPFLFISETIKCETFSINEIYSSRIGQEKEQKILKIFKLNQTFITVSYRLTSILISSYKHYRLIFDDKLINTFNQTKFENNLSKSDSFIYGPIKKNEMHES